jgi:hypothetical protein
MGESTQVGVGVMPTRNGLILPFELVDQQLKAKGIDGHVDVGTGLFIPKDNEQSRKLLTTKRVRPRKYTGGKVRRT